MVIPEGVSSPDTILNIFAFKRTPFSPLFCDFFVVAVIILIEIFPNENKEPRGWEGRLPGRPWVRAAPPLPAQPPGSRLPDPRPLAALPSVRQRERAGRASVSPRSSTAPVPEGGTWEPRGLNSYFWSLPCSGGMTFGTFLSLCLSFL